MAILEIYTRDNCGYCERAMGLIKEKDIDFREYNITSGSAEHEEMKVRSGGGATFPQIFIFGKHVGGCDDLMALEAEDKLDELLKGD